MTKPTEAAIKKSWEEIDSFFRTITIQGKLYDYPTYKNLQLEFKYTGYRKQRKAVIVGAIQRLLDERDANVALQIKRLWMEVSGFSEAEILRDCHPAAGVDAELEETKSLFQIKEMEIERLKIRERILKERIEIAEMSDPEIAKKLNDFADDLKEESIPYKDEIQRLKQQLESRENLIIEHARHAGMDTSKNSWKGCNNWLVGWIDQQLDEATNPDWRAES